jgi:hypothetical protein
MNPNPLSYLPCRGNLSSEPTPLWPVGTAGETDAPAIERWIKVVAPAVAITGIHDAATYLMQQVYTPFALFLQEEFVVLLLDSACRVRYAVTLYRGTINSALVRSAEVFREAVRLNAFAIVVAHNHPSGNVTPSHDDIALTRALRHAGHLLEIELLDHFIVGENRWTSLRAMGLFDSPLLPQPFAPGPAMAPLTPNAYVKTTAPQNP